MTRSYSGLYNNHTPKSFLLCCDDRAFVYTFQSMQNKEYFHMKFEIKAIEMLVKTRPVKTSLYEHHCKFKITGIPKMKMLYNLSCLEMRFRLLYR